MTYLVQISGHFVEHGEQRVGQPVNGTDDPKAAEEALVEKLRALVAETPSAYVALFTGQHSGQINLMPNADDAAAPEDVPSEAPAADEAADATPPEES